MQKKLLEEHDKNHWPRITIVENIQDWKSFTYGLFKTYFHYSNGKVAWRLHYFKGGGKKENWLALLITVDLWVVHTHILMSTLEIENKPQFLIN